MEASSTQTPNYQQVVVDVPEDRVAEFHAFFARFLAGPAAGRRRRPHRRPHHGRHHHRCAERHDAAERTEAGSQPTETTEV